jgi:hypothetical protein
MIGNYAMADEETISKILNGKLSSVKFLYGKDDNEPEDLIDIDKTWYAIHFTLTGDAGVGDDALSKVVLGMHPLGDEDVGYGPPMYLTASDVAEVSSALQVVSEDDFTERFSVLEMKENNIYPVTSDENEEEFLEYCLGYYVGLKDFFAEAAERGLGVVFWIN